MLERIDCHGMTHVGQVRTQNQDQFLIADLSKSMAVEQTSLRADHPTRLFSNLHGKLMLVADGMGGHAAGERASTIAVDSITNYVLNTLPWFFQLDQRGQEDLADELKVALKVCQDHIQEEAAAKPEQAGMGTTATLAYVLWPRMFVVHAGDSRCYLLRRDELRRITKDQTVAQQLVDRQLLDPESAETSKWSNVLWNVVGGDASELASEVYKVRLEPGDVVMLCSDGLTKHLTDDQLTVSLASHDSAKTICDRLVTAANDAGGTDNITVVVAKFLGDQVDADSAIATKPNDPLGDTLPYVK